MKKILLILLVLVSIDGIAQKQKPKNLQYYDRKRLRFGYSLGYTTMDFTIRNSSAITVSDTVYSVENKRLPGFHLNIVSEVHLVNYLDVRFLPGLSFGERDLKYLVYNRRNDEFDIHTMQIESTFLDFPLLLKYSSERLNNYRAYIIGGGSIRYDLAAQREISPEEKPKVRLRPLDCYYELGFGVDYFFEYFKFATEIKLAVGVSNVLIPDNTQFSRCIYRMNSKIVSISLHFEGGKYEAVTNFMGKLLWWKS
ncbi:MAG: PorT family protein [Bacteroidetes bacterium]|nr:PorT family protein [Bacteroidota bacterium]